MRDVIYGQTVIKQIHAICIFFRWTIKMTSHISIFHYPLVTLLCYKVYVLFSHNYSTLPLEHDIIYGRSSIECLDAAVLKPIPNCFCLHSYILSHEEAISGLWVNNLLVATYSVGTQLDSPAKSGHLCPLLQARLCYETRSGSKNNWQKIMNQVVLATKCYSSSMMLLITK